MNIINFYFQHVLSLNLHNTREIFSRLPKFTNFLMNDSTWGVLCKSWADRNWSGIERNVGKCDSVPVCGRAGEPSGTTILVCDFGVPSLMIVSTRFRLRFFTGGEKHEAPPLSTASQSSVPCTFLRSPRDSQDSSDRNAILLLFSSTFLI